MRIAAAAVLLAISQLASAIALAEDEDSIWVWATPDGAVHYTDDRERIPEAYRESARVAHRAGGGSYQRIPAPPPAPPVAPAPPAASAPAAAPPTPADLEAAAEAAWREQARQIDARIAVLAPEVEACGSDHVNLSAGDGSRKRREEHEEAQRCAKAKEDLAEARADRETLEERAHREDVPPGWIRTGD